MRRWKDIKKDPEWLTEYNNRVKQISDKVEKVKPIESVHDQQALLMGHRVQRRKSDREAFGEKNTTTA